MGGMLSTSSTGGRYEAGSINLAKAVELLIEDSKTHLETLECAASSIGASTDAQYELVQSFFEKQTPLIQAGIETGLSEDTGAYGGNEVSLEDLTDREKRVLAFIQDDICVQAIVINRTINHLKSLIDSNLTKSGEESPVKKKIAQYEFGDSHSNQSRLSLNYLKADFCDKKRKLEMTDEWKKLLHIEENIKQLSGEINVPIKKGQICTDTLSESKKERQLQRTSSSGGDDMMSKGYRTNVTRDSYPSNQDSHRSQDQLSRNKNKKNKNKFNCSNCSKMESELKELDEKLKKKANELEHRVEKLKLKEEEIMTLKKLNEDFETAQTNSDKQISCLQQEKGTLEENILRTNELVDFIEANKKKELSEKDNEIANLGRKLKNKEDELHKTWNDINREKLQLQEEVDCLKLDMKQVNEEKSQLKSENDDLISEHKEMGKALDMEKSELHREKENLRQQDYNYRKERSELMSKMKEVKNKNVELESKVEALTNDIIEKEQDLRMNYENIKTLNVAVDDFKSKLENSKMKNQMCVEEKEEEKRKQQKYRNERDDAKNEISNLKNKIRRLEDEKQRLEHEKQRLHREVKQLENEKEIALEKMRQRRQVSVMLYMPRRGDLLNMVVSELRTKLTQQFSDQQLDLTLMECERADQIQPNKPVMVVCINASRLGTDVTNAMTGIRGSSQVAVVILHHKELHALPNQSSERVLTSQEYKSLGGIIDMAFLSGKGLYQCDLNRMAMATLTDFIRQRNSQ